MLTHITNKIVRIRCRYNDIKELISFVINKNNNWSV